MANLDRHTELEQELRYWDGLVKANPNNPQSFVRRGMAKFKLGQIQDSIQDFDRAQQLDNRLTPYLWQRGLAYYYAKRFEEGATQFEIDLTVNGQDVEETVWRYLCIAQSQDVGAALSTLLPVRQDPRPYMRWVYDLYAEKCSIADLLANTARDGQRGKFYGHLYAGLYYEVREDEANAKHNLTIAAEQYPLDDYMWHLAIVHCRLRGWN